MRSVAPSRWAAADHEIGEGDAGEIASARAHERTASLLDHVAALVDAEQGRLARMRADRQHEPVGEPNGLTDQVKVAVGERGRTIPEKARCAAWSGGLARTRNGRKVALNPGVWLAARVGLISRPVWPGCQPC